MKKIICILLLLISTLAFSAKAAATIKAETLEYFDQYSENKQAFLQASAVVQSEKWKVTQESWSLEADPQLTTDISTFRQPIRPKTILVISSGLHGIEGFVGSAVQRWFISKFLKQDANLLKDMPYDVSLVHSLNPWGMQNKRRVNADNIDLNRNFSNGSTIFEQTNDDYMKIDNFLNPTEKLQYDFFHRIGFLYHSIKLISQFSIETLRKSILLGQNQQSRGLYFAGKKASRLKDKIDEFYKRSLISYEKVVWIDLHTGYGKKGQLHLLANDSQGKESKKLEKVFAGTTIDYGNQKNFYKTDGDLANYLTSFASPKHQPVAIVFEYGTLNSQTTLGSIESLRRMVIENQAYQNGPADLKSALKTKELFQTMFFPQDPDWKKQVVEQTEKAFLNLNLGEE